MPDDFDDIIDEIRKYFKLGSNKFDVDFLFIPESERRLGLKPEGKKIKAFKISYHFESGMEKPEIRIEGNIDEEKIQEYFEGIDISQHPTLKKLLESSSIEEIDAGKLSLETSELNADLFILEPPTEVNDYNDHTEIVFEIPGMSEDDVIIDFDEEGRNLIFKAENQSRRYIKNIFLPFTASTRKCDLQVKNGLAIIRVMKSDK
ncbi:MAG: Hsp20/alpha crystallin family protein [Candidatus Hodarchaeota archaeon]